MSQGRLLLRNFLFLNSIVTSRLFVRSISSDEAISRRRWIIILHCTRVFTCATHCCFTDWRKLLLLQFLTGPLLWHLLAYACYRLINCRASWKVVNLQTALWLVNGTQAQANSCPCRGPVIVSDCYFQLHFALKHLFLFQLGFLVYFPANTSDFLLSTGITCIELYCKVSILLILETITALWELSRNHLLNRWCKASWSCSWTSSKTQEKVPRNNFTLVFVVMNNIVDRIRAVSSTGWHKKGRN